MPTHRSATHGPVAPPPLHCRRSGPALQALHCEAEQQLRTLRQSKGTHAPQPSPTPPGRPQHAAAGPMVPLAGAAAAPWAVDLPWVLALGRRVVLAYPRIVLRYTGATPEDFVDVLTRRQGPRGRRPPLTTFVLAGSHVAQPSASRWLALMLHPAPTLRPPSPLLPAQPPLGPCSGGRCDMGAPQRLALRPRSQGHAAMMVSGLPPPSLS